FLLERADLVAKLRLVDECSGKVQLADEVQRGTQFLLGGAGQLFGQVVEQRLNRNHRRGSGMAHVVQIEETLGLQEFGHQLKDVLLLVRCDPGPDAMADDELEEEVVALGKDRKSVA